MKFFKYTFTLISMICLISCSKEQEKPITPEKGLLLMKAYENFPIVNTASTDDGEYVLLSKEKVAKINSFYDKIWEKSHVSFKEKTDSMFSIVSITTKGSEIWLCANGLEKGNIPFINIIKCNKNDGSILFNKKIKNVAYKYQDPIFIVHAADQGNFIIGNNDSSYFVFNLSPTGDSLWLKYYFFGNFTQKQGKITKGIFHSATNSLKLIGSLKDISFWSSINISDKADTYNSVGNIGALTNILETEDENFLLFGYSLTGPGSVYALYYVKINAECTILNQEISNSFNNRNVFCNSSIKGINGNYVLCGTLNYNNEPGLKRRSSIFIKELSNSNVEVKTKILGENYGIEGLFINQNSDETYTIFGNKIAYGDIDITHGVAFKIKKNLSN